MISFEEAIRELENIKASIGHDREWEKLRDRIMSQKHTAASLRELDRDVKAFFKSNATREDKVSLMGYTESLAILMDAIDKGLLK